MIDLVKDLAPLEKPKSSSGDLFGGLEGLDGEDFGGDEMEMLQKLFGGAMGGGQ